MRNTSKTNIEKITGNAGLVRENEILIGREFTPRLVELIDNAHTSIFIFMFDWRWYKNDFSCDVSLINQALVRATRRGVSVKALINYAELEELLNNLGIETRKATMGKLLHAKSIVVDEEHVVIGSHNLTQSAMGPNVEMSAVIRDKEMAGRIITYHATIWRSSI